MASFTQPLHLNSLSGRGTALLLSVSALAMLCSPAFATENGITPIRQASLAPVHQAAPVQLVDNTKAPSFGIPRQDLDAALRKFAALGDIQVIYDASLTNGLMSTPVSGARTREEALHRMLEGTGLVPNFSGARSVTILAQAATIATDASLSTINVQGEEEPAESSDESAWGPVQGFVASQSATGTKTDTPIIETPQTVNVVGQPQMQAQGSQTVTEALRYTPGVSPAFGNSDSRTDVLQSRGFYLRDYLDGARVPFGSYSIGVPRIEAYGLERVEVLKGPASVLYGQNTPGGILNLVTKRPRKEKLREIQLQAGSFDRFQGAFDLSGPLNAQNNLQYRLTGLVRDSEGRTDFAYDDRLFLAPSLAWQPTYNTSITFLSHFQKDDTISDYASLPAAGTLFRNPNGKLPQSRYSGEPEFDGFEREQYSLGYVLEHRFNDAIKARQTLKYTDVSVDTKATPGIGLLADDRTYLRVASHGIADANTLGVDSNLQADFSTGALQHMMLFGLDYLDLEDEYRFSSNLAAPINIYNPVYGAAPPVLIPRLHHRQNLGQTGVYVQDQIKLGGLIATLGGRYDWAESETRELLGKTYTEQDDEDFTWRAGVNYLFKSGLAPYVSYSTSFEPAAGTDFSGNPFKPTTGEAYEGGIKYQPPGRNSLITISAFDITQANVLTPDRDPTHVGFSVQTGEVQVQGYEIEAKLNLAQGFDAILGYALTDSEITKDNPNAAGVSNVGNPLARTPKHLASAWLDYTFQHGLLAGLGLGGGVRYVGSSFSDNTATLEVPSFIVVDAAVRYDLGELDSRFEGMEVSLNAANLLDYEYVGYCGSLSQCYYGQSRTVLATLKFTR